MIRPASGTLIALAALLLLLPACNFATDLDEVKAEAEAERARQQASEPSDLCLEYCGLFFEACASVDPPGYANETDCLATCAALDDTGVEDERWGDTVQCRISHLETASEFNPELHCLHGGKDGGGKCVGVSPCGNYCGLMLENCEDEFDFFDDEDFRTDCVEDCREFSILGRDGDTTGDSFQCRVRAAAMADSDPATLCPEAATESTACVGEIPDPQEE